ncbi:MAG TPA: DUF6458 family protein [Streptosporangiaceae bacterium]|nr:DUF6458 family protein [Streptosporangiaceae bacterium]
MKTATGLFLIALGAVLAFAVNGHPWFINLQVVGWILMVLGAIGLAMPRRGYGWLRRQMVVKRGPDGRPVAWTRSRADTPHMMLNPAATTTEGTAATFDRAEAAGTPVVPVVSEEIVPEEEVIEEYFPE